MNIAKPLQRLLKPITLTSILIALTACGGGGDGGDGGDTAPSLSGISGVWDFSTTYDQELDERYYFINASGVLVDYDYQGDSYDQGPNCFYNYSASIFDLGNGEFLVIAPDGDEYNFSAAIYENTLVVLEDGETFRGYKSSLQESDFTPLCDDIISSASASSEQSPVQQKSIFR